MLRLLMADLGNGTNDMTGKNRNQPPSSGEGADADARQHDAHFEQSPLAGKRIRGHCTAGDPHIEFGSRVARVVGSHR